MDNIKGEEIRPKSPNIAVLDEFFDLEKEEDELSSTQEVKKMERAQIGLDIDPFIPSTLAYEDYPDYYPNQGFKRYHPTLKTVFSSKLKECEKDVLPIDRVGMLSFISFWWMSNLLWKIYRKGAKGIVNYRCPILDGCRLTTQRLTYLWQEEIKIKGIEKASFDIVTAKFVRTRWAISTALFSVGLILGIVTPVFCLAKLIEFLETPDAPLLDGLLYVIYIFLIDGARTFIFSLSWAINIRTGLRLRSAISGILFNKIVRLKGLEDKSIGELINLFANDSTRIFEYILWGRLWISGSLTVLICLGYIFWLIGIPALTSIGVFVLFYCLQIGLSKGISYYRFKAVRITDKRVRQMTEILNFVKMIKLYAWEESFFKKITDLRKLERKYLEKMSIIHNIGHPLSLSVPIIAAIATFLTCYAVGYDLTSAVVFPVVGALILSRTSLLFLPLSAGKIAEYKTSIQRSEGILKMEDFTPITSVPEEQDVVIKIINGVFAWNAVPNSPESPQKLGKISDKSVLKSKKNRNKGAIANENSQTNEEKIALQGDNNNPKGLVPVLHNIEFTVSQNKLVGICGKVGSGKTTIINTILGQLNVLRGDVQVRGTCSYVSQQAWIMNATVLENITFGEPYDEKRIQETIQCCGLSEDLEILPAGLDTEIGERGVNLSGGQKHRISLARAVYSNRDIYLLDDPLSAVDYRVGAHIFQHCIKGVLKNKTVLFVSHMTHYLDQCDHVIVLSDGKIHEAGDPKQLKLQSGMYAELVTTLEAMQEEADNQTKPIGNESQENGLQSAKVSKEKPSPNESEVAAGKRITSDEKMERGGISRNTYNKYIQAMGGYFVAALIVVTVGLNVGVIGFSNWWLSSMINSKSDLAISLNNSINITIDGNETSELIMVQPELFTIDEFDMLIYGCMMAAIFFTILFRAFVYVKGTLRASTQLHKNVLCKIIESPMRFFETVPIGRIINIFSKDQDEVDTQLSIVMESFLNFIWMTLISIMIVILIYPWFFLPLAVFAGVFYIYSAIFQGAMRELKRFENVSRSPLFGHISAMIQGLATIHSFQKEEDFAKKFCKFQDQNTILQLELQLSTRWLAFRLDILVVLFTVTTGLFMVFWKGTVSPSFAALALSYSAQMGGMLHFLIRNMAETQARFTNVERIVHYTETLVKEGSERVPSIVPSRDWPSEGEVEFKNVSMRYREGLPLALNDVSFKVGAREKVGIIGRTGSGKSSLAVVMFRLVELAGGSISIDETDISQISLLNLRQKLSLIPQDPVLFLGTIRYNLDTSQKHTDEEIWGALEKTGLKEKISSLDKQLYAPVVENGENFSVGERQLLCLTRALLRNSQIILLDEATASVDANTDALVQQILQEAFSHCTIMTIAHRIHTVLNYDRILILSYGQLLEYDSPTILRSQPNSVLSMLLNESKDKEQIF